MLISFAYRLSGKILSAVAAFARCEVSNDAELLVLLPNAGVKRRVV
jgi:hypothetical protein